ncbi:HypC/HybG/HupF family hydrogenase formation chaperone [Phytoactinopolyspora halotolerans]|uniref:HypC/HybG/HupF family hydrogenase formation chaperone n=2 Tax=Phytoactinopolyspora halotolerans TaxID=1981512 RepID=A0A6L9S667_9ACTN|nr:HypC/HybG/HupF family hydrogenase formation chaperone [Phytoactinopolyspora halotolerans]
MCLGIPGQIIEMSERNELTMGTVDFGGIRKDVCLTYVPGVTVGDYVIVHVGFAITQVDEDEARRTLDVLRAMDGAVEGELGRPLPMPAAPSHAWNTDGTAG